MNALEKLQHATNMLAEVRTAADAKKLINLAASAEYYAQKAKLGQDAINYAHTIRMARIYLTIPVGSGIINTWQANPPHSKRL